MFNFLINRLLKRAGLTPESLQELVERGTKDLDELDALMEEFGQNGGTIKNAFTDWQVKVDEDIRKAKQDADQRRAEQDEKVRRAKQLDDMLGKLRPGMHIRELDQIIALFGDEYAPEALRNQEVWSAPAQGKCTIDYDDDGLLTRVNFFGATQDTLQVAQIGRMDTVLQTCAGVVHAADLEVNEKSRLKAVEIASNTHDFTTLAFFWCGRFRDTTYLIPSERDRLAKAVAAKRPPEPAKPEVPSKKTPEQLEADTALRKVYYAWADQNGDDTYRELVEWIIHETSPEARHYLLGFNWDIGFDIPFWIIRQPGTYLASALKAFEMSQASDWLTRPKSSEPGSEFAHELNQRIRDGFFATPAQDKAIAYTPPMNKSRLPSETAALIAPAVFEPLIGRSNSQIYCIIPEKFIDYLN